MRRILRNVFIRTIAAAASYLEALVQKRRCFEQTPKHTAERAQVRTHHEKRGRVAGDLPVLQVRR